MLLLMKAGSEHEGVKPGGGAGQDCALGDGAEVGEDEETGGGERGAGYERCVAPRYEG